MRVLLLMMTVLISVFARSQAVFEIETPSSIKGFYKFGLSDSTIDYRWGNGNTANKAVSASLAGVSNLYFYNGTTWTQLN